jgi:hypothetical protein
MQLFFQRTAAELLFLDQLPPAEKVPGVVVNRVALRADANEAQDKWEAAKRAVESTEKRLRPIVKLQKVHLKMNMALFEEACREFFTKDHESARFWDYDTGPAVSDGSQVTSDA